MAQANGNGSSPIRFKATPFAEIQLGTDRSYLIKGLVPNDGLVVVWGPPKCGKSFFMTDVALHIALGWEYRGKRVQRGTVVYVICEGQAHFPQRIEAFRQAFLPEDMSEDVPFFLVSTRLDLAEDAEHLVHDIIEQIGAPICSLVVIDTLNRSMVGSESKDEDMAAYIRGCDTIRERLKSTVAVIHHCGHEATRPRGHTSLSGAADAQIAIKKDENDLVSAQVEYMKDGPDGENFTSKLRVIEVGKDEDGDPIRSCVIDPSDELAAKRAPRAQKLPKGATLARQTLERSVGDGGETAPANNYIPPGKMVVRIDLWRRVFYQAMGDDVDPETKKKAFQRARVELIEAGQIGVNGPFAWIS